AAAAGRALRLLHLVAGVSYYKAAVPATITVVDGGLDAASAALLEEIYLSGLGEFAYRNGLDLHGRIRFPAADGPPSRPSPGRGGGSGADGGSVPELGLCEDGRVGMGGGKGALVSNEGLRAVGVGQPVAWIGGWHLLRACAGRTGRTRLIIGRQLARELFD